MSASVVGVAHTGITVSNIERAIRLFSQVFGATVTEPVLYVDPVFERVTGIENAQIRIAYADLPGHRIELLEYVNPVDKQTIKARPCDPGHLHLSLKVAGIDGVIAKMADHGFHPVGPVQKGMNGKEFQVVYTYGFDGLVIELMDFSD
jgi:catechol 2,3-dioxygenase-like lactoylglutathione lyase family enzyme